MSSYYTCGYASGSYTIFYFETDSSYFVLGNDYSNVMSIAPFSGLLMETYWTFFSIGVGRIESGNNLAYWVTIGSPYTTYYSNSHLNASTYYDSSVYFVNGSTMNVYNLGYCFTSGSKIWEIGIYGYMKGYYEVMRSYYLNVGNTLPAYYSPLM